MSVPTGHRPGRATGAVQSPSQMEVRRTRRSVRDNSYLCAIVFVDAEGRGVGREIDGNVVRGM